MTTEQVHLLRKTFRAVERAPVVAALIFYRRLFELNPRLRPLFKSDIESQSAKLMEMLALTLSLLDQPGRLTRELEELGARHTGYGVRPEHYAIVGEALLNMLAEVLGKEFTPAARTAWTELYGLISQAMLRGALRSRSTPVAERPFEGSRGLQSTVWPDDKHASRSDA